MTELDDFIQSGKVFVFSWSMCPYCDMAKAKLNKMKIAYKAKEIDILPFKNHKTNDLLDTISGIDTVPKIFIGKKCIGGYDDMVDLIKKGGFYELLQKEGISYEELK